MSRQWRDAAGELEKALGVTVSVVDVSSGATLDGGRPPAACSALLGAEPVPGLTCVSRTDREISESETGTVHGHCAAGLATVIAPVLADGAVVTHVMISGFVGSTAARQDLLARLRTAGSTEEDAVAMLDAVPTFDLERADAAITAVVRRAEALLRERQAVDEHAARGCETAMLAEVARDLGPAELMFGRIPEGPLRSLMRLAGADSVIVHLSAGTVAGSRLAAQAGEPPDAGVTALIAEAREHVSSTGRSFAASGTDGEGRKASVLAVPVSDRVSTPGALVLVKTGPEALCGDDVRLAELFAETLGAMLANARDFVDANTKLVELMQVNEVAQLLNATLDRDKLSELLVEVLAKTLIFEVGGFVVDGFGERRGRVVHMIDLKRGDLERIVADAWGIEPGTDLLEGVDVVGRSASISEDGSQDREWTLLTRELRFRNVRAGELFVAASCPGTFDLDDERILGALAGHLSTALENAVLYARLQRDFERAIAALSALADATERLDRGHTDRVMDYAVSLGEEMDLSLDRIGLLRFAGLLHDLGKVGIAEEILVKPSMLTAEEMELVRRHSEMGATIVEQVRVLDELTPIVRHHHEHWDGTGYPDGLAGEEIPLEARILAVADAFEAMTGKRYHRRRMPASAARLEIERGAGTQFDPTVARAFLAMLDRRALFGSTGAYAKLTTQGDGSELPA